ncbi:hypothetical protein C5C95_15045 [Rathayibacter sp. AY1B7]|uniref:antitoxin Xre/MbcA/ParS toxin-binding domain-containing protein n=1 Tax=unclassified Rathayibacter TaxID=2609250 RepID=UPI000CE8FC3C|nr:MULTISPECIES: antitoxin Xre/MbcA/ParS toxin-binding domain-containing protein [unclassified Rathayibacter]PPH86334.1 hypothetical protein C5C64_15220 [Rathayibacter sp. AY1D3]PPH96009.1 hypothetical protein C5C95_15045 [Rathayibacter sp. AY1B7]
MSTAIDRYKEDLVDRFSRSVDDLVTSKAITDFSQDALDATASSALAGMREANRVNTQLGAFYTIDRVMTVLGNVSRQAVNERVKSNRLLRVQTSDGKLLFPAFQFQATGGVHPQLSKVLQILLASGEDGWTIAYWLTTPIEQFGGRTALDVIGSRETDEILDLMDVAADDAKAWHNVPHGEI